MKQYQGNIFFEENDFQNKISGAILTIENDNFTIEFQSEKHFRKDYSIIQGEFSGLGYVTLIECYFSGSITSIVNLTKYNVQHLITNVKINSIDNLLAKSLYVKMDTLKKWLNLSNLSGSLISGGKIEYSKSEKILIYDSNDFSINIHFCLNEYSQFEKHTITLTEFNQLEIISKSKSVNIFELYNIYKKIKVFLAFIGVFSKENDEFKFVADDLKFENQFEPITMKFFTKFFDTTNDGIITHNKIEFKEIEPNIFKILDNWLTNDKIQDSIVLVMEKYTFIKLTVETYFLNTCFAIETFHRKNRTNKVFSGTKFRKIKDGIRAKLQTQEEIDLFNDKLIYANEPTFKNRLISLEPEFNAITINSFKIDEFIERIVKTRNYLVHRGSKKNIFSTTELYYASIYLETLTKYCIMENIGFEKDYLKRVFANSGKNIDQIYKLNSDKCL